MAERSTLARRSLLAAAATLPVSAAVTAMVVGQRRGGGRGRSLTPPVPKSEAEKRVLAVIAEYDRTQRQGSLSVPFEDGRLLRILATALGATRIVEIGTSFGYSGLWLCLALGETGGRLTTFEVDESRQARARANFDKAGVLSLVDLVLGDAHEQVTKVKGPVDMVFSDADKEGYVDYLQKLLPALRPGGLFVTHNIDMAAAAYLDAISTSSALESTLVSVGSGDLAVTVKKR